MSRKFKKFSRKSEVGLAIILILIVVLFFFGWLINLSQRECSRNKDCGSEEYCGSDFSCHANPVIQKTVVQYDFIVPSIIIGIAIFAGAIIFRRKMADSNVAVSQALQKTAAEPTDTSIKEIKEPEEVEEIGEPYYKSENGLKAP